MRLKKLSLKKLKMLEMIVYIKDNGIKIKRMEEDKNIIRGNKSIFTDIGRMESLFKD